MRNDRSTDRKTHIHRISYRFQLLDRRKRKNGGERTRSTCLEQVNDHPDVLPRARDLLFPFVRLNKCKGSEFRTRSCLLHLCNPLPPILLRQD